MAISILQLSSYVAFAIFVVVLAVNWKKWSDMPIHLRWELYPVPHEKGRNKWGGSYFEELDWWTKPKEKTLVGEMKELFLEMLFIKRLFEHKRNLWFTSYPFHAGIYLILAWFGLLFLGGLTEAYAGITVQASGHPWGMLLYYLTFIAGGLGIILGVLGGIGTLVVRLSDEAMKKYSAGVDYFNLVFVTVVFALGGYAFLLYDFTPAFATAQGYMTSLVSFGAVESPVLSAPIVAQLILVELLFVYIPFTKMSHFLAKYFTYHKVLWEDEPNIRGSKTEAKVREALSYKFSWDAPHFKKGKTWFEEATKPESLEVPKEWKP